MGSIKYVERAVGDVEINEENFPDTAFRDYIRTNFDTNKDGILSSGERDKVTTIMLLHRENITSIKGVEYFPNLTSFVCLGTRIISMDVSNNLALAYLNVGSNPNIT